MSEPLDVRGGFAGTAARTEDLDRAAGALRGAVAALDACAAALARVDAELGSAAVAPAGAGPPLCAVTASGAEEARAIAVLRANQAEDAAGRLARVAAGYREAEAAAGFAMAALRDVAVRFGWQLVDAWSAWRELRPGTIPRLTPTRDVLDAGLARLGAAYRLIAAVLASRLDLLAGVLAGRTVIAAEPVGTAAVAAPDGVAALITTAREVSPEGGGDPGTIAIDAIVAPDGTRSYVVTVPGTQEWTGVGTGNPFDLEGNAALAAGLVADSALAVAAAMRDAGIPRDAPVMLVGHSQGGMAAMALAGQPAFRERFNVVSVVTAGSPVGRYRTPDGVAVLHLEHSEDAVAGLDGARNPDDPARVTVTRHLATSADPRDVAAARGETAFHRTDAYVRTGAAVDSSEHASIAEWRRASAAFMPGEGATAERTVYAVERAAPEPHPPLSGLSRTAAAADRLAPGGAPGGGSF